MLTLATFNLCNLGADAPAERMVRLAELIVQELQGPDILAVQEIKGDTTAQDGIVPAVASYRRLGEAIISAGGPPYAFREIPPLANRDGGLIGANIRVGLLFNEHRVTFTDRGSAGPEDMVGVRLCHGYPALTLSPGRIAPTHPAFAGDPQRHWAPSRKALAAELHWQDKPLFIIVCHLKSMRAVSRRVQDYAKKQRQMQAQVIHGFIASLLACEPSARVIVLGDMNDVLGSKTLSTLKGQYLHNALEQLPRQLRYTRLHGGRPQALDHLLFSQALRCTDVVIPHVNTRQAEWERVSDHDPVLAQFELETAFETRMSCN